MKTTHIKTLFAAGVGLAFFALAAHAQLMVNVNQTATFDNFVGGSFNGVTNNGSTNTQEVITTGLPLATPFSITYNPITGPANVTIPSGTLNTTSLTFHSTINPSQYFTSVRMTIDTDFDNNGISDLTQVYTISLSPFTAPNGFTGVAYSIIPVNFFGNVTINGTNYSYASVVANSAGTLFDGSSTTSLIQFQFQTVPVPEPSTYALFGVLTVSAATFVRRKLRRSVVA